jgi:S1-C subfamily serine protease
MTKQLQSILAIIGGATVIGLIVIAAIAWTGSYEDDQVEQGPAEVTAPAREELPNGLNEEEKANIRLFERAKPSVCYINTSVVQRSYYSRNAMEVPRGSGSGFTWDKDGHIITNFHVIRNADLARVTLYDGSSYEASLVGVAPEKDLAVLKIDAPPSRLKPIPLSNSYNLQVGQIAYAIGNPFGLDYTFTKGIISALGREIKSPAQIPIRDVIQTDAAINPGNSGGPLLNSSGELIGVNTAIYSPSGASAGIGFSIPVDEVRWVVPELIRFGEIRRPTIGIEPASPSIARRLQIKKGVLIINNIPGGPADRAGLRPTTQNRYGEITLGDIIIGIDNEPVNSLNDLLLSLEKYQSGEEVTLRILRDEEELSFPLVLAGSN